MKIADISRTKAAPADYLRRLREATRIRTRRRADLIEAEADVIALIQEAADSGYSLATVSKTLHAEGYAILDSRLHDLAEQYPRASWTRGRAMATSG